MTIYYAPEWFWMLPEETQNKAFKENTLIIGSSIYKFCPNCKSLVKINKMLFGSAHICN